MKTLVCAECGRALDEDDLVSEMWGDAPGSWNVPNYPAEYIKVSPCCHGAVVDGVECQVCGEYFQREDINDFGLCEECAQSARDALIDVIKDVFTVEAERDYLLWRNDYEND